MRYAALSERLAGLGHAKWELHFRARDLAAAGREIIFLSIGEPDVATPPELVAVAAQAMAAGRTGYSDGRGDPALLGALAARYTARLGRRIGPEQIVVLPGTQTAMFAAMAVIAQDGDEVLVGDPMYATYESVIAASGARTVPVPLHPEHGFRLQAADVAARISPRSRVLFLNSPHNPTGAVLRPAEIAALAALAVRHDLWLLCDEVYEDLIFGGAPLLSPLADAALADRAIAVSSISKSHAAPGFRAGWCLGSAEFCARLLPLCEAMLFSSVPFISDMAAAAVSRPSPVAAGMAERFERRAALIHARLDGVAGLRVHRPEAGMFALIDVRATGLSGRDFAAGLLDRQGVAVMPGESFGSALAGWLRVGLSQPDARIDTACARIAAHVAELAGVRA
jgi:arginine:pyruvate transaminase